VDFVTIPKKITCLFQFSIESEEAETQCRHVEAAPAPLLLLSRSPSADHLPSRPGWLAAQLAPSSTSSAGHRCGSPDLMAPPPLGHSPLDPLLFAACRSGTAARRSATGPRSHAPLPTAHVFLLSSPRQVQSAGPSSSVRGGVGLLALGSADPNKIQQILH
jgi:hypothetical protein